MIVSIIETNNSNTYALLEYCLVHRLVQIENECVY